VLYAFVCAKPWGEERCFTLLWLVVSRVSGVRCINIFTHKFLRNKGDNLAAIVGHIKQSVLGN